MKPFLPKGLAVDRGTVCFPVGFVEFFPNDGIYSYIYVNGNFIAIFTYIHYLLSFNPKANVPLCTNAPFIPIWTILWFPAFKNFRSFDGRRRQSHRLHQRKAVNRWWSPSSPGSTATTSHSSQGPVTVFYAKLQRKTGEIFFKKYYPNLTCQNAINCNTSITATVLEGFYHLVHSWTSINLNLVLIAARWFFRR